MKKNISVSIRIPADPAYIPIASFAAYECAVKRGFTQIDAERISLALEEAVNNAIEFSYGASRDKLEINIFRTAQGLGTKLQSLGIPLEQERLPQYKPERMDEFDDTSGLSFFLMKKLMDRVSISIKNGDERELLMTKYLPGIKMENCAQNNEEAKSEKGRPKLKRINTTHILRLATPNDAEAISRLVLRAHGEVMFCEHIYYPDRVKEMLESGEMVSGVAEAECGELIGHCALVADTPGTKVEEFTYGVMDGRFRSRGVTELAGVVINEASKRGIYAIYSMAVTNHVHSQRILLAEGFKECSLFLAASPASHCWNNSNDNIPARIGNLVFLKELKTDKSEKLYIPARHEMMVRRIYEHLGSNITQAETPKSAQITTQHSQIYTKADLKEGWTSIIVLEYGIDFFPHIKHQFHNACAHGIPSIQIMLPLNNPATPAISEKFENMDFFFAGIGLSDDGNENIVLQYLNNAEPDFEKVHIHSDFARELKDYVQKQFEL
ncbi:ATP-binding protein [Maridesulfovibrio ferrireducens]|uniref:ATP-binding protein n=1 Tax=Maridesulfovibrio ferrireducens TaxID=246191 RepID=UPI001A224A36|nr:ATP-binding protein [Maridesulfovibrio ferrireducens]MBI9110206.1 ATP-binding protein [Maridesulfovibrio ferrireducens]